MRSLLVSVIFFASTASQAISISSPSPFLDFNFGEDIEIPGEFEKAGTFKVTAPEGVDTATFDVIFLQCPLDTHGGPTFGGCIENFKMIKINEVRRVVPGYFLIFVRDRPGHPIAMKTVVISDKDQIELPLTHLNIKKGTSGPVEVSVFVDFADNDNWLEFLRKAWGASSSSAVITDVVNRYNQLCRNNWNTANFPTLKTVCEKLAKGITRPEDLDGVFMRRNPAGDREGIETKNYGDGTVTESNWVTLGNIESPVNKLWDGESVLVFPGVYSLHFKSENGQTIVKRGVRVNAPQ